MSNVFDSIISEVDDGRGGMKDVGLGERTGKDELARNGVRALDESRKIEAKKLSELVSKVLGLEAVIQSMQLSMVTMEQTIASMRGNTMVGFDDGDSDGNVRALPAEYM